MTQFFRILMYNSDNDILSIKFKYFLMVGQWAMSLLKQTQMW